MSQLSSTVFPCKSCCAPIPTIHNCVKVYPKPIQSSYVSTACGSCCGGIKIPLVRNKVVVYSNLQNAQTRPCGY